MNFTAIKNDALSLLPIYKSVIDSKISTLYSTWTNEFNSFIENAILYNHARCHPELRAYYIIEVNSGLCLSAQPGSLVLQNCGNLISSQMWNFNSYNAGPYAIKSQFGNYYIDDSNNSKIDGNSVNATTYTGDLLNSGKWSIILTIIWDSELFIIIVENVFSALLVEMFANYGLAILLGYKHLKLL